MKKYLILTVFVFFVSGLYAGSENKVYTQMANVQDSLSITAPNVFTPNGDGVNDSWSIIVHGYGVNVFGLQTTVYDRWGKQVFETTNIHQVWSGHNKVGIACDAGTYFYVITYTNGATGELKTLKGFVELFR